jgi:hypothetical protein
MKPTLENVLPEYRLIVYREVHKDYKEQGAILSMFGGSRCPWCNEKMNGKTLGSFLGICTKNPEHIVQWLPWGG